MGVHHHVTITLDPGEDSVAGGDICVRTEDDARPATLVLGADNELDGVLGRLVAPNNLIGTIGRLAVGRILPQVLARVVWVWARIVGLRLWLLVVCGLGGTMLEQGQQGPHERPD